MNEIEIYKSTDNQIEINVQFDNDTVWLSQSQITELFQRDRTVITMHRIEASCAVGNSGSIRVIEKSGMLLEGRKRQILPLKSGWSDNFNYAILASDLELHLANYILS